MNLIGRPRILASKQPFPFTKQAIILIPLITAAYETAAEVHWNLLFPSHFPPTKRSSSCANQWQQLLLGLVDNLLWDCRSAPHHLNHQHQKNRRERKKSHHSCLRSNHQVEKQKVEEIKMLLKMAFKKWLQCLTSIRLFLCFSRGGNVSLSFEWNNGILGK